MAKVVMTRYLSGLHNVLIYPECPYAGKDCGYISLDFHCELTKNYCSVHQEHNSCPYH